MSHTHICRVCSGITEAFINAVRDVSGLGLSNAVLVLLSVLHICASVALLQLWGAAGLIAADGLNMVLRIGFSLW